jgi:Mn2+/Fe2+ NRAMP family transporter
MATSAIGPGFLNNTASFTEKLSTSFGFVILASILLDIGAQLNTWRIITASEMHAQDLANKLLPGLGFFLSFLVAAGGLAFNIGNIAGCGLGLDILTGQGIKLCAIESCLVALAIFWFKEGGKAIDGFVKILGLAMIALTLYIVFASNPPVGKALLNTVWPETLDVEKIVVLVGGTVGGYISFAGAHRLLDAGVKGRKAIPQVSRSAVSGIVITSAMRFILFLAALGVVYYGGTLDQKNPAASVFKIAAGNMGYKFFGVVMWSAAITSVVGASYTSVSFWKSFHPSLEKNGKWLITGFIIITTVIFLLVNQTPSVILVAVGALNGLILPVALAVMLIAANKTKLMAGYKHPLWMQIVGWVVVLVMSFMGWVTIRNTFFA